MEILESSHTKGRSLEGPPFRIITDLQQLLGVDFLASSHIGAPEGDSLTYVGAEVLAIERVFLLTATPSF